MKKDQYPFDYHQVRSNIIQHTHDLKNVINGTTNILNNGYLVPVPKNIEDILTIAEQRELKKNIFSVIDRIEIVQDMM